MDYPHNPQVSFLTENMCDEDGIERSMRSFNKSFGILFRKFYSLDIEPFYFLWVRAVGEQNKEFRYHTTLR